MLFSPPGHVQRRGRQRVPNLSQPCHRSCRAFGVALFTNVGKRLLEMRAAVSAFLALTHVFLHVSLVSICSLLSFNAKIIPIHVKSERNQSCRFWGTMGRSSHFLLGSQLLRVKLSPSSSAKPHYGQKCMLCLPWQHRPRSGEY